MNRGKIQAKDTTKKQGPSLAKAVGQILGVGLAAGAFLIAATDKTMKKKYPKDK